MRFPVNLNHDLVKKRKIKTVAKFISWQVKSRIRNREFEHVWISGSKFIVRNGESGLTQNIYVGLHEFEDMCFLMHILRQNDLFIDVGANSGSYSILAGAVCKAKVISIEPVQTTYQRLVRNLALNNLEQSSTALNVGLGDEIGHLSMTSRLDTTNQIVIGKTQHATVRVEMSTLDEIVLNLNPVLIKIDVEGWETKVLQGGLEALNKSSLAALIIELNESGGKYGFSDSKIVTLLAGMGFKPYFYDPINRVLTALSGKNTKGNNTIFIKNKEQVLQIILSAEKRNILDTWI